jgi:DNA-binding CsgD family transcriptional regulator
VRRGNLPPQQLAEWPNGPAAPADCGPFKRSTIIISMLTPAQRRSVRAVAVMGSHDEAGFALGVSVNTIHKHVTAAMRIADVHRFTDFLIAVEWLRVPPEVMG